MHVTFVEKDDVTVFPINCTHVDSYFRPVAIQCCLIKSRGSFDTQDQMEKIELNKLFFINNNNYYNKHFV